MKYKIVREAPRGLGSCLNSKGHFMPIIFWRKLKNTIYFIFKRDARKKLREYNFPVTFFGLNCK